MHLRGFIGIPIRNVKRCKTAATIEGVADICNGGSIPRGNVKRSKTDAIIERSVEYFYFCGVPAGKVKRRQRRTITKQELHMDTFMQAIQDAYWKVKAENREKYTTKKNKQRHSQ